MFRRKWSASADRDRSRATAALCQDGHEGAAGLYTADDIQTSDPPPSSQARRTVALERSPGGSIAAVWAAIWATIISTPAEVATRICRSFALLAQLVEHFHGKEGVAGSSPAEGFENRAAARFSCFRSGSDDHFHRQGKGSRVRVRQAAFAA
jgi:hypothetical protein